MERTWKLLLFIERDLRRTWSEHKAGCGGAACPAPAHAIGPASKTPAARDFERRVIYTPPIIGLLLFKGFALDCEHSGRMVATAHFVVGERETFRQPQQKRTNTTTGSKLKIQPSQTEWLLILHPTRLGHLTSSRSSIVQSRSIHCAQNSVISRVVGRAERPNVKLSILEHFHQYHRFHTIYIDANKEP
jgi:hypothetical protein